MHSGDAERTRVLQNSFSYHVYPNGFSERVTLSKTQTNKDEAHVRAYDRWCQATSKIRQCTEAHAGCGRPSGRESDEPECMIDGGKRLYDV